MSDSEYIVQAGTFDGLLLISDSKYNVQAATFEGLLLMSDAEIDVQTRTMRIRVIRQLSNVGTIGEVNSEGTVYIYRGVKARRFEIKHPFFTYVETFSMNYTRTNAVA